jgi:hypothetical protein
MKSMFVESAPVEASHGVAHEPTRLLRRAGAPRELIEWTRGRGIDSVWDECDRGDWLVWLGAVEHVPAVSVVQAAVACARRALRAVPKGSDRKVLAAALRAAQELRSSELCAQRAEGCERLAGKLEGAAYRVLPSNPRQHAAAAVAAAARAAETLLAAEAQRFLERDQESRLRAASLGVGDQIISRGVLPPLVYDPDDELLAMCFSAAEGAVVHATHALAPTTEGPETEAVEVMLSERVFAILDPVRTGLGQGRPAAELVPAVAVEPYGATEITRSKAGGELAEAIQVPKRVTNAVAIGVIVPLGGMAHHYAGHHVTGWTLTLAGIASLAALTQGISLVPWLVVVAADLLAAPAAVRRHNAGKASPPAQQLVIGLGAVLLAVLLGWPW